MNIFASIIFGHLFGDYIFQNNWMAMNKGKNSLVCATHCAIYTLSMLTFTWTWSWIWALLIFGTHFPIDRWSLGDKWLKLIKGRAPTEFLKTNYEASIQSWALQGGFTALVYVLVDNTFHLAIAYYGYLYLFT